MTKKILYPFLSFCAGAMLVFAFAPANWFLLAFLAPAVFLYCLLNTTPKQSFWSGLFYGIGLFGVGTSWLYISIHQFGNTSPLLAGFITLLFILLMSLYPATLGYLFTKLFKNKPALAKCLLIFPAMMVIWEWLRSYLMTGFPWLFLGYTQTDTYLSSYATVFSVYGVSLVVATLSGALYLLVSKNSLNSKITALILSSAILLVAIPLHFHHWTQQSTTPQTVALVQGNIPPSMKWEANKVANNIDKYIYATEKYWGANLIIWPEAAVPITANSAQGLIQALSNKAKAHHTSLLFGIPLTNKANTKFYNGMLAVGLGQGKYLKRHLVPYGEYIPIPSLITPVMKYFSIPFSDLSKGPDKQKHLLANHLKVAPLICYEVTYPFLVNAWAVDANVLVTVNDDAWFGDSYASPQQVQMAQMRSIETERYMLYSSNTGITAIIAPSGKITALAPIDKFYVLTGKFYPTTGNTPVMALGFYPILIVLLLMLLGGVFARKRK